MNESMPVRTVIERGPKGKRAVAFGIDWPGWSRGAKSVELALETLESYRQRYRPVAGPVESASPSAVLLFDGVFLQRPELREGFDLCVFLAVSFDEVLRRALEREVPLLGSRDDVERRYRTRYIPGQRLYFAQARPEERADVVVRNDDPAAPVLERVGGRALSPGTGRPAR